MTRAQLKAAIAEFTGLRVEEGDRLGRELNLYSPNGRLICTMGIFDSGKDGWQFGGIGSGFPDDWKALCRLHEVSL